MNLSAFKKWNVTGNAALSDADAATALNATIVRTRAIPTASVVRIAMQAGLWSALAKAALTPTDTNFAPAVEARDYLLTQASIDLGDAHVQSILVGLKAAALLSDAAAAEITALASYNVIAGETLFILAKGEKATANSVHAARA